MVNRLWFERRFCFLRYHVLRVSTVTMSGDIRAGIDFIALLKFGDTGTHCLDNTGNVPARNKWQRKRNVILHVACSQSMGFTEAAWTLMSNSPEPGVGRGASSNRSTSGPP